MFFYCEKAAKNGKKLYIFVSNSLKQFITRIFPAELYLTKLPNILQTIKKIFSKFEQIQIIPSLFKKIMENATKSAF